MKTSQWIKDVRTAIGCEPPQLFKALATIADKEEGSDRGQFARKTQSKILECIEAVKPFLGEIRRNAQDYTLHDIEHCSNVIDFMGQMLVDIKSLNPAEISFFIYSALLHDIGMVKLPDEDISLDELREDHGERSARFIRERVLVSNDDNPFSFGEWDEVYMEYLPSICASHMQEFSFVEKLPQSYFVNGMEIDMSLCAILLRIADAMDLKRNRAPYQLYQFIVNRSISEEHWKKHLSISNCQVNSKGVYRVDGICHDEAAHRCLYNHLDMIEAEIEKVFKWKIGPHQRLKLSSHIVERNINTQGYTMWHHSLSIDISKITNLFMGEQLYGDKRLGLREIIQNSIDACMVRDEMNKKLGAKQEYNYEPEILIVFDSKNNQVIIRDNGTGMNDYIIQNYFLNIGASYYSSNDFKKKNLEYSPSGYFGIGFLSAFMLSNDVYVRTAHWQEDKEYEFHFIKSDKFVTKTEKPKTTFTGTEVRLNLNQFKMVFENIKSHFPIEKVVADFILNYFWNIIIHERNNDVIVYKLNDISFTEYLKEKFRYSFNDNKNNHINLNEYLKDIEGIILLSNSILFNKFSGFFKGEHDFLNIIKKGDFNISPSLRDCMPYIEHFYTYNFSYNIIEDDKENNFDECRLILFPTKESNIPSDVPIDRQVKNKFLLKDQELNSILKSYKWNCMCIDINDIGYDSHETIGFSLVDNDDKIPEQAFLKILCNYIGYTPNFYIIIFGLTNKSFNQFQLDKYLSISYIKKFWINNISIDLHNNVLCPLHFSLLGIKGIFMKISNSHIMMNTTRESITRFSSAKIIQAILICICLWIYDQIKNNKEAIITTEYLKQLILEAWDDSVEGILRPEKKPV